MGRDICSDIGKPSNLTHVCIVCGTVAQQAELVARMQVACPCDCWGGGSTLARDSCSSCTVSVVVGSCAFASGKGGQISVVVRSYVCSVFVNALGDMCSDECCLVLMRSACRFRFRGLVYHDIIGSEGSVQSSDEMHRGGS